MNFFADIQFKVQSILMSAEEDDLDAFLYGQEEETPATTKDASNAVTDKLSEDAAAMKVDDVSDNDDSSDDDVCANSTWSRF